jgi:hypothetical protein
MFCGFAPILLPAAKCPHNMLLNPLLVIYSFSGLRNAVHVLVVSGGTVLQLPFGLAILSCKYLCESESFNSRLLLDTS